MHQNKLNEEERRFAQLNIEYKRLGNICDYSGSEIESLREIYNLINIYGKWLYGKVKQKPQECVTFIFVGLKNPANLEKIVGENKKWV